MPSAGGRHLVAQLVQSTVQHGEHLGVPVVDKPGMTNGRAYYYGGWHGVGIRERGPSGTFRNATTREMRPGESNRGGTLLDHDTYAMKVGVKEAGRELDGRTWDELPTHRMIPEGETVDV